MANNVKCSLKDVAEELEGFPEPPEEPNYVVMDLIRQVGLRLSEHIDFKSTDNFFRMEFDAHLDWFSQQLLASRLEITVEKSSAPNLDTVVDDVNAEPLSGSGKVTGTSTLKRKRLPEKTQSVLVGIVADDGAPVVKSTLGLEDLSGRYERGATNSIPGSINDKVTMEQIRESCSNWKVIVTYVLQEVSGLVTRIITESMENTLRGWEDSRLYQTMFRVLKAQFERKMETAKDKIHEHLSMMLANPDIAKRNYEREKNIHLERLLSQRYPLNSSSNIQGSSSQRTAGRIASDEHRPTIDCVATIYTYHDLLSDNIAITAGILLRSGVLEEFKEQAEKVLRTELKVLDSGHCAELLAAKPEREEQRKALVAEKAQLEEALKIIEEMQDEE